MGAFGVFSHNGASGGIATAVELLDGYGNKISSTSGALDVAGSFTAVPPTSSTASSPSQTSVGTSAGQILASNSSRKRCIIQNTGLTRIYLGFGQTPTTSAYHVALPAGGTSNDGSSPAWVDNLWIGAIQAISSSSGGTVVVTEFT